MKTMLRCISLLVLLCLAVSAFAAVQIRNVTARAVLIRYSSGKTVTIAPKKAVSVSQKDLDDPAIVRMLKAGTIRLEKGK